MDENQLVAMLFPSTPTGAPSSAPSLALADQAVVDKLYPQMLARTDEEQADHLLGDIDPVVIHSTVVIALTNTAMQDHMHDRDTAQEIAADWTGTQAKTLPTARCDYYLGLLVRLYVAERRKAERAQRFQLERAL